MIEIVQSASASGVMRQRQRKRLLHALARAPFVISFQGYVVATSRAS